MNYRLMWYPKRDASERTNQFPSYIFNGFISQLALGHGAGEMRVMQSCKVRQQIAALPLRRDKNGRLRILMITSRDTGRWVMPKGWLMDGKKPWHAAEIEALEEAGAVGHISNQSVGYYHYWKRLEDRTKVCCRVTVYPLIVEKVKKCWKERSERRRKWFAPDTAASLVQETELRDLLKSLSRGKELKPVIDGLKKAC